MNKLLLGIGVVLSVAAISTTIHISKIMDSKDSKDEKESTIKPMKKELDELNRIYLNTLSNLEDRHNDALLDALRLDSEEDIILAYDRANDMYQRAKKNAGIIYRESEISIIDKYSGTIND